MLGLMKKDLFMLKNNLKILVILLLVYGIMALEGKMNLAFLLPFMSVMIMTSTFSYDTYNKWDAYVITLPNGRKNSVKSKYLTTILVVMVVTVLLLLLSMIISYITTKEVGFETIFPTMLGAVFATSLLQAFMYPVIYQFGIEKARIAIFLVVLIVTIIGGMLAKLIDITSFLKALSFLEYYWTIAIPIVIMVMLWISYKISEKIYLKKEF